MQDSRRSVLRFMVAGAAAFGTCAVLIRAQNPFPGPPIPVRPGEDEPNPNPGLKSPKKVLLEENQKDIKKNVEKLFDLAAQLKEQVEKTDATTVLSMAMVKKADEIERLAHQIKERAKG